MKEDNKIETKKTDNFDWVPYKAFFTLKEAAELKGINYKTFCNRTYLQPNRGKNFKKIGGRKVYDRETIIKWLPLSDQDILKEVMSEK